MSFSKIYPLLVSKAEKKGVQEEVTQVITWLTGYTAEEIEKGCGGFFDILRDSLP